MPAQHNEKLRLKFITFCTTIVLKKKYTNPLEQPSEDKERKSHQVMISVAIMMNNRIYSFHHCYSLTAFLVLFLYIF